MLTRVNHHSGNRKDTALRLVYNSKILTFSFENMNPCQSENEIHGENQKKYIFPYI